MHDSGAANASGREARSEGRTREGPRLPSPLGRLWGLPARWLHARRRRAALSSLRMAGEPRGVLFICTGNIYRSPFAAACFQRALPRSVRTRIEVRSAGFVGADRPCLPDALELAAAKGLDLSGHRSTPLTLPVLEGFDLLVVMDPLHRRVLRQRFPLHPAQRILLLGDLDPAASEERGIVDPWNAPPDALQTSYARIERCVDALVRAIL